MLTRKTKALRRKASPSNTFSTKIHTRAGLGLSSGILIERPVTASAMPHSVSVLYIGKVVHNP